MDFVLNPNSLGFKDMDPLQIKEFVNFIDIPLSPP